MIDITEKGGGRKLDPIIVSANYDAPGRYVSAYTSVISSRYTCRISPGGVAFLARRSQCTLSHKGVHARSRSEAQPKGQKQDIVAVI